MMKYRQALKNYSVGAGTDKKIKSIQAILLDFGARGIGFGYDENGKIETINFKIRLNEIDQMVEVPFLWKETAEVLREQGKYKNDDHAYAVSVANVRDWLDAQLALEATRMVKFEQVFLPYIVTNDGRLLYERIKETNMLQLKEGDDE